ncbi:predicted protein [Histoplasma capsulatum var. duboisii H88]|uniref:Predicted protein n=1 Tax=Ajellomyces capsulatus (strain H88) TaxID=544711 RepID=F0UKJ6_AJEC8|nr:predicted protein [Histoplasma capsulatum var. duboisii H88]
MPKAGSTEPTKLLAHQFPAKVQLPSKLRAFFTQNEISITRTTHVSGRVARLETPGIDRSPASKGPTKRLISRR